MKPETKIENLVKDGAIIALPRKREPGDFNINAATEFALAHVDFRNNPKRMRWCAIFPQHQGHVHELRYDKIDATGIEIRIYRDGEVVATMVPLRFSLYLDKEGLKSSMRQWRERVAWGNNEKEFMNFFDEAI